VNGRNIRRETSISIERDKMAINSSMFVTVFFQSIYQSQLTAVRQRHGSHSVFTRNRFRIRRDHILEDAYNQMSALSEDDLRGVVCAPLCVCIHASYL
jgi:hypothetical protein